MKTAIIVTGVAVMMVALFPQKPSAAFKECLKRQSHETCSHTLGE